MARYVIERTFVEEATLDPQEVQQFCLNAKRLIVERFPDLVWEHSHVAMDAAGRLKSFCVFTSPNEEAVREHAHALGGHVVDCVYELGGGVTPNDFPD